jgi:WD40 repeat protein
MAGETETGLRAGGQAGADSAVNVARLSPPKRSNAARLFGYDVFISFALGPPPRGTQSYASDLARRLRERDFTVFFSEDEAPPGELLDDALRVALHRSKTLVVIANRATLETPRWVRTEVEEFRTRHPARPIVSISVGGALQDRDLATRVREWLSVDDKIWLDETDEAVERGIASEALVDRLATAPMRFRSNVSWRWVVRVVVASLVLLAIALAVAAKMATDSAERARAELRRAVSLRLAAEAPAILSGARREGDERALLQLVAARRLAGGAAVDGSLLDAMLRRRYLIKLIPTDAPVNSVSFSPDGSRIASGDRDFLIPGIPLGMGNNVRLWNARTGEAIGGPLGGHTEMINAVAFSPDGRRLASASYDGTIRFWNPTTGQPVSAAFEAHAGSVNAIAFSEDGTRLVSGHSDETIRLWNVQTGQSIGEPLHGHELSVDAVAFSRDGTRIASGSSRPSLRLWDATTRQSLGMGDAGSVMSMAFSPDGSRIIAGGRQILVASGDKDDDLRLWDARTGEPIGDALKGHQQTVNGVAWSRDGTLVASASVDTTIRLWKAETAQPIGTPIEGHMQPVNSVEFSHDSRRLVSGGDDSTIRVWDVKGDGSIGIRLQQATSEALCVAFTRDGARIVSGHRDGKLRFWDHRTGRVVGETSGENLGAVQCLAVSPDGERIAAGHQDGLLRLWDARMGSLLGKPFEGHRGSILTVAWNPDGARIASGGFALEQRRSTDHVVRLWEARTGQLIRALEGHTRAIATVAFTPDGRWLVSASDDLRFWDLVGGGRVRAPLKGGGLMAINADGSRIVESGSGDGGVLRLWDANTGQPLGAPLDGHSQGLTSVAFSPDGSRIVSGSRDGTMRVWDAETQSVIGVALEGHPTDITSIAFSTDGTQLVSCSTDGIRVWPAPQRWADVLCSKMTRNMSRAEWREWVSPEVEYVVQCPGLPVPPDAPKRR